MIFGYFPWLVMESWCDFFGGRLFKQIKGNSLWPWGCYKRFPTVTVLSWVEVEKALGAKKKPLPLVSSIALLVFWNMLCSKIHHFIALIDGYSTISLVFFGTTGRTRPCRASISMPGPRWSGLHPAQVDDNWWYPMIHYQPLSTVLIRPPTI
jgi:hypothetical protein